MSHPVLFAIAIGCLILSAWNQRRIKRDIQEWLDDHDDEKP